MTELTLLDTNVLVDIFTADPNWAKWSGNALEATLRDGSTAINAVVYAELAVRFPTRSQLDATLHELGIVLLEIPREGLFAAAKAFALYRQRGGSRQTLLPDFFIGGQAQALGCTLATRDAGRYRSYFPSVPLIAPDAH